MTDDISHLTHAISQLSLRSSTKKVQLHLQFADERLQQRLHMLLTIAFVVVVYYLWTQHRAMWSIGDGLINI
jgi:hypothetical protein